MGRRAKRQGVVGAGRQCNTQLPGTACISTAATPCSRLPPHRQQVASKCAGEESVRPREGSGRHEPQHEPGVGHKGDGSAAQHQQGGKALGQRAEAVGQVAGQGCHGASQQPVSQASLHGAWQLPAAAVGGGGCAAEACGPGTGRASLCSFIQAASAACALCSSSSKQLARPWLNKPALQARRRTFERSLTVLGSDHTALTVRRTTGTASGTRWGCCLSCLRNDRLERCLEVIANCWRALLPMPPPLPPADPAC